jgi:CPA1 family monovalent cation:H+ antiporter
MHETEIILGLMVVVAALAWVAQRLRVPYPILLVVGGLGLALVPHLPQVALDPHLVFVLFLPPILYYAGMQTSWRDFKANIRPISMLAVGLVLFTTVAVAAAAKGLFPGMSWAAAFVLGAIVSPPDAVAATAILQRLRVPRRVVTILEGESLVNDATALVTYQFAVLAVVTGEFSITQAAGKFILAGAGGVAAGLVIGIIIVWIRPRLREPLVENVVSLLTPWIAYLPADWMHLSGVLSVVTCGIYISRRLGRITTAQVRLHTYAVWDTVIFLLNGLVFVLIGLQVSQILRHAPIGSIWKTSGIAIVIAVVAIAARLAYVFPVAYTPPKVRLAPGRRGPVPRFGQVFLVAWTQMRGVVSLAAALALPITLRSGEPFPFRSAIIFVTFVVILVTLVAQGLTLPALIRALKVETASEEGGDEEVTARYLAALAAVERLDQLGAADAQAAAALQRLRAAFDDRIAYYSRLMNPEGDSVILTCETGDDALRQSIAAQRDMLLRLRDQGVIGDDVQRLIEQELDHEEWRIGRE